MLTQLSRLVADATESLDGYDYARVLERTESFFWGFCDDYLEMVKARRYGDFGSEGRRERQQRHARRLSALLRLFAHICRLSPRKCGRGGGRVGAPRHVAHARRSDRADRR
jgi:valyl-tRNA synthetase